MGALEAINGIDVRFEEGLAFDFDKPLPEAQTHGCVYMIRCPETKQPIYIGQSVHFKVRCYNHMSTKIKAPISVFIQACKNKSVKPIFEVIDLIEINHLDYWERFYIDLYKGWGFNLLNVA